MTVISTENLSKRYRLGVINRRYLYRDLQTWFANATGRKDPNAEVDARVSHAREGVIWALRDVNIDIKDGDVVGIIGRNGSGKSTLLKILSRITAPTKGSARVKGRVASLLEVGTGFHQELTGRENVYLNGSILGMPKDLIDRSFDEIVEFAGVEEFIDTPVKRYSSGMTVRLAFAVAAHLEPDILIVDEVLAVGDAAFQKKCLSRIGEAARSGRTVLFVSHNAAAVENLCSKGIVLNQGAVCFAGSQSEALDFYSALGRSDQPPLGERQDRKGTGEIRLVNFRLTDAGGRPLASVAPGQEFEIGLQYENPSEKKFPQMLICMHIKSHLDVVLFYLNNHITGDEFGADLGRSGWFRCRVKNLAMLPGSYKLDFWLLTQPKGARILDWVEDAATLEVSSGDFFGSGQLPHVGYFMAPARWSAAKD